MSYYPTLREDVERAKEILAKAQPTAWEEANFTPEVIEALRKANTGHIAGGDIYDAYMLLASFVEVIETVDVKVCELAVRARRRGQALRAAEQDRPSSAADPRQDSDGPPHGGEEGRVAAAALPSITCPRCGRTSYNRNDVRERYCGACHEFHETMPEAQRKER